MEEKGESQRLKRQTRILQKEILLDLLWKEKDWKIKSRLSSLNLIANCKMGVKESSFALGIPVQTIYDWIAIWNKEGYEGLKGKPPSPGRPSRLDEKDMERLKGYQKVRKTILDNKRGNKSG